MNTAVLEPTDADRERARALMAAADGTRIGQSARYATACGAADASLAEILRYLAVGAVDAAARVAREALAVTGEALGTTPADTAAATRKAAA